MAHETHDGSTQSEWQLSRGPVGGNILTRQNGDNWEIIVPAGQDIENSEGIAEMMHWRHAVWSAGHFASIVTIGLDEAACLAPDQEDWMYSPALEELTRDMMRRHWPTAEAR